jgi:outer membrane receptor protein involved in Fe transport
LKLYIEIFGEKNKNPVKQWTRSTIVKTSGEIFRNAVYKNISNKSTAGMNLGFDYNLNRFYLFTSYRLTDNSEGLYYPRNSFFSKVMYGIPENFVVQLNFNYTGRTIWEEFIVSKENDYFKNAGTFGESEENFSFDFVYYQKLNLFTFFKDLTIGFTVQNIFNKKIRYLPIGNFLERTLIFSLYTKI